MLHGGHLNPCWIRGITSATSDPENPLRPLRGYVMIYLGSYQKVLRKDPCSFCGKPSETLDHVQSKALGGTNYWTNLVGACRSCNAEKGSGSLLWFLMRRAGLFSKQRPKLLAKPTYKHPKMKQLAPRAPILGTRSRQKIPAYW